MCAKIVFWNGSSYHDLRADLSVDVEIEESTKLLAANCKCLLKIKTQLQSKEIEVLLPHPILIRPEFFYKISIGKFPDDHCYYSKEMKTEMQLESDIRITFHGCHTARKSGKMVGVISVLNFNKILSTTKGSA